MHIFKKFFVLTLLMFFSVNIINSRNLIHPGLSHKLSDLERMKLMVKAGKEPWKTSFANLQANQYASYNYTVKWSLDSTRVVENLGSNYEKFKYDALACYYNALQWYITGDARYAEKSVEILNKMRNIRSIVSATQALCAGRVLPKLMEGAEIIKSTYPGWKQEDIDAFKAMLVYPGYSTKTDHSSDDEHSFYWAMFNGDYGRHGNQGLFGMLGTIQIAVFSDNEIMYDRIVRYMRGEKHRPDDLPYVSGPTYVNSNKNTASSNSYFDDYSISGVSSTVSDYGYNEVIKNYIWENGQTQEASRDQGHSQLALGLINNICEIAWNQGDDMYSILDNRPLLGIEYYLKYNLSYYKSYSDQPSAWEPTVASGEFIQRRDRSQRWFSKKINPWNANDTTSLTRGTMFTDNSYTTSTGTKTPMYAMALGHYKQRINLPAGKFKWLNRADSISRKLFGYERQGFQVDYLGFGNLAFQRADSCPGDPVTFADKKPVFRQNIAPCTIQAEDFDYMTSFGNGRAYYKSSGIKTANVYRPDSMVVVKPGSLGGYKVSNMAAGEWLRYSVYIPEYSKYRISVNYSAINSNGKLKLKIGNQDKTTEISLPATGSDIWADYTLLTDTLLTGLRSFQVFVSGESNVLEINSLKIEKALIPAKNDYVSNQSGSFHTASNWRLSDGNGGVQATIPSAAPVITNNVWIQSGHVMTATAAVNVKNMVVSGSLTVGSGTGTTYDITLGSASAPGSLFIQEGGMLSSTTPSGGTVSTLKVFGNTISVNGQLGSADAATTAGSGIRLFCENEITTISGNGKINIGRLQSGSLSVINQEIIVDADVNLLNAATSGATLSLLNGNAGSAEKTLTINEGKTVTFTGGSAGLLHQMSSSTAQSSTGGNINYNIYGTLDTGNGGLYLTTSTLTASATQEINIHVGANGELIIGPKFILIKSLDGQSVNFKFDEGSQITYKAGTIPAFSSTAPVGITPATFPLKYSKVSFDNPNGFTLTGNLQISKELNFLNGSISLGAYDLELQSGSLITGAGENKHLICNGTGGLKRTIAASESATFPVGCSLKRYDPVVVVPSEQCVITVKVDSVFGISPVNQSLTNPVEWNITADKNCTAGMTFKPSKFANNANPVVAQIKDNSWTETMAVLNPDNSFSATFNTMGIFGTGTLSGFGSLSALTGLSIPGFSYQITDNKVILQGVDQVKFIQILDISGRRIAKIDNDFRYENEISFNEKGVYFLLLSCNNFIFKQKFMIL